MSDKRDFFEYCHTCILYDKCNGPPPPKKYVGRVADSNEKPQGCGRFALEPRSKPVRVSSNGKNNHFVPQLKSLADLANLFVKGEHRYHYEGGHLPVGAINIFRQPRRTFERIHELGLDMAQKGQLGPIIVAPFDKEDCREYLNLINLRWQDAHFTIADARPFSVDGREVYETLIAGERRTRGWSHRSITEFESCPICQDLWTNGCEACKKRYGPEPEGNCYIRHFGGPPVEKVEPIEVRFCVGITPLEAVFLQLSENTHMPVPSHEEARAYAELFKVLRVADETFPMSLFATFVGRSADTVRNAIHFCELPTAIQQMVGQKIIPYGVAIELSRLKRNGLSDQELDWWFLEVVTQNHKTDDFRKLVTEYLKNRNSGQTSLLDIFDAKQKEELAKPHFRMVVERHTIQALWSQIHYTERVLSLFKAGKLGKEDSPFSVGSPIKVFQTLIDKEKQLLPYLKGHLPEKAYKEAAEIIEQAEKLLARIEEAVPK